MPADYDGVGAPEQREDEERQHRADVEQANRMLRDDLAQMEARAEKAEAEQDELAAEIETLKDEREQILSMIQTRLQPEGSPPPGGPVALVNWITNAAWKRVAELERQLAEAKQAVTDYMLGSAKSLLQCGHATAHGTDNGCEVCAQLAEARKHHAETFKAAMRDRFYARYDHRYSGAQVAVWVEEAVGAILRGGEGL